MYRFATFFIILLWLCGSNLATAARPNLLLITLDDISAQSVGVFGARVPGTTPQIDRLAAQGMRFEFAHVPVASCMPSRNVMWSGRFPHSNGVEGFRPVAEPNYPTLFALLREAGYFVGVRHKVRDSTPYAPWDWDLVLDRRLIGVPLPARDAASYGSSVARGIAAARARKQPFALLINVADAHVPLYGLNKRGAPVEDRFRPSRVFTAGDVVTPDFLPEDPVIREELAHYYSSVRRADDAVGAALAALADAGVADDTLVLLLADHGMPFPFSKTQLYHDSTHTPLVFRWPGEIAAGAADRRHLVSSVDLMPTLLQAVGLPLPDGLQGRSLLPLLKGGSEDGRDHVVKAHVENSGGERRPMRAVQTRDFLYIFNPWSNGRREMHSAAEDTATFRRLQALASADAAAAQRLDLLLRRVPEELYDLRNDPGCLRNRIDDPDYRDIAADLRGKLLAWQRATSDPALAAFEHRDDPAALEEFMRAQRDIREREGALAQ